MGGAVREVQFLSQGVADFMGPAGPIAAQGPLPQVTVIACNPTVGLRVEQPLPGRRTGRDSL
ncbi:hypothetical protein APT63_08475 [Pseudomonas sp. 22-AL-CL-001]|nr:hypothetical protein APT63_08475 [Pseudomonas monteilii]